MTTRQAAVALGAGILSTGLVACGGGNQQPSSEATVAETSSMTSRSVTTSGSAAVCADVHALRASMDRLKSAQVGQNALSVISAELTSMRTHLNQLATDARDAYTPQTDAVIAKAGALKADLQSASASPSASTLSEVAAGIRALGVSVDQLVSSVSGAC